MKLFKVFLYFTYAFVVVMPMVAGLLYLLELISFGWGCFLIAIGVLLNLSTYFAYRFLCQRQAINEGKTKEQALVEFENEFPGYKD